MFRSIFSFELNQWFNKPLFYVYAVLIAAFGGLMMAAQAGLFEGSTSTVSGLTFVNSPLQLLYFLGSFSALSFFLLPSVIGSTLQKDYQSNMYHLMYSFPFKKSDYVFGKLIPGLIIFTLLLLLLAFGVHAGTTITGVDQNLVVPFNVTAYLQIFTVFLIPNMLLFSAIVFSVTLFTRSMVAGFIAVAALFFGQSMADTFLANQDYDLLGAYLDPFGLNAVNYYAKYWTVSEQNESLIPIKGVVVHNRIIWLVISLLIFSFTYVKFSFHTEPISLKFWKNKNTRKSVATKSSIIQRVDLPKVDYNFGWIQSLKSAWSLSKIEMSYIFKSGPFIIVTIIAVLFMIIMIAFGALIYQTATIPVTRSILTIPGFTFSMFITLLTFIYTGLLMQRSEVVRIYQLEDATAAPTWMYLLSKFMTVTMMQIALLAVIMITGVIVQIYNGYFNFEFDLYLFDLYGVRLIHYVIWSMLAFFVFALVPNFYLGIILLLIVSIGLRFIGFLGVEQDLYKYNDGPTPSYSDLSKYDGDVMRHYVYKLYWFGLGLMMMVGAYLMMRKGVPLRWINKMKSVGKRFNYKSALVLLIGGIMFFGMGWKIYQETNVTNPYLSSKEREERSVSFEKTYKHFGSLPNPRIVDVSLNIDMLPEKESVSGTGKFLVVNKTHQTIDSFFVDHNRLTKEISLSVPAEMKEDDVHRAKVFILQEAMQPGDSLELTFQVVNEPNSLLRDYSPISKNGTFFNNMLFPTLGYNSGNELNDDKTRTKYGLEKKERMASPYDTAALANTYIANDADWISFEAILSTAPDQIAMAPGKLQRTWEENGRQYFHYKMPSKMVNFYGIISAKFEVYEDQYENIPIRIYHHKGHDQNLERMARGAKKALAYCSENFTPYQHEELRILEFPATMGGFAQAFANTVPFSEGVGFLADVDDSEKVGVDYPFSITAHEVAHQWWAHQVIGANVQGATVMSESLSEYVSLKVLEQTYGQDQMRLFLKTALDKYLQGRTTERKKEQPLAFVENQPHIHYNKGSLILYTLSDYIGEDTLNKALKNYAIDFGFQEPPYTTSLEFVSYLRAVTPDSLQYFIDDSFLEITVYNNRVLEADVTPLEDGTYEVSIEAQVSKYRADEKGRRLYKSIAGDSLIVKPEGGRAIESYPLGDYVEVGIFRTNDEGDEEILYLRKHKIEEIINNFTIIVDQEPQEVGIDPFNKLIDTNSEDNRKKID